MTSRRKLTTRTAMPAHDPPAPRERFRPAWLRRDRFHSCQFTSHSIQRWIEMVGEGYLRLPRFQRDWVWTDEQIVRLFDSIVRGYHVGSLLLWERHSLPPSRERFGEVEVGCPAGGWPLIVVDGQQRLGALMTAAYSGRFWLDLNTGVLERAPGPWRAPTRALLVGGEYVDHLDWPEQHAREHGLPTRHVQDAFAEMLGLMWSTQISAVKLPSDCTLQDVLESFRRVNTEGTKIDPAELEAALARAEEG